MVFLRLLEVGFPEDGKHTKSDVISHSLLADIIVSVMKG